MSIDNKIEDSKQKAIKLGIFQLMQDVVQNTPDPDAEKALVLVVCLVLIEQLNGKGVRLDIGQVVFSQRPVQVVR